MRARTFSSALQLEHRRDLGQCKPCRLGITDEPQTLDSIFSVVAIATCRPGWLVEQPDRFVVPNCLGGHTTLVAELTDLHARNPT